METFPETPAAVIEPTPRKNRAWLIWVIVILFLCCCCLAFLAGAWFLGDCFVYPNDPGLCPLG